MPGGPRKRSYRNFLLDRRFQLKYATLIALTGGVIFGVMAMLFFDKVKENSDLAAIDAAAAAVDDNRPQHQSRHQMTIALPPWKSLLAAGPKSQNSPL